jgi:hypothetical protein
MSTDIKTALTAAEAEATKAVKRVQDTVVSLQAQIDAMTASGTATDPADVARIVALTKLLAALDPTNPATLPPGTP